ncbi:hypothetical protein Dacet_1235 [Denitrovibrio acetiphilus DSM 12809]|uniref:Lipoprotein n=1 Tax=Denitrovibrio acetiphilus (strain DSM 12809 / NBRC 114555 / N2460) TaxID=522772 RepID=D4H7K8_DENA2|nr:LPS assembly lipoprotein LptE [Denitrovibrio acetiphilus]ADD68007.1 hypothetical protein Dacet_1235 [Denitrovibrio acetiphilus DSM 12809]
MTKKAVLSALLALIIMTGCGYRIVITGKKAAFTIFPSVIANESGEIEVTSQFKDSINLYLATINALASENNADYTGEFTLTSLQFTGASSSSTTTTAYANMSIRILIEDKKGDEVFMRTFNASEDYANTSSMSETRSNRDEAVDDAINKIMTDFRNAFEK